MKCQIQFSESYPVFRNYLFKEIRPQPNPLHNIHSPSGIKLLTRLRLGSNHWNEHKFNHSFDDCINLFRTYSLKPVLTLHFFLHCHHCNKLRSILFKDLNSVDKNLIKFSDKELTLTPFMVSLNTILCMTAFTKLFNKAH